MPFGGVDMKKMTMEISDEQIRFLKSLSKDADKPMEEVFADAIGLLYTYLSQKKDGYEKIVFKNSNGSERELVFKDQKI